LRHLTLGLLGVEHALMRKQQLAATTPGPLTRALAERFVKG